MAKGGKGRKGGGGGGGKTRKYSRDNNGRFASTGTGATARGGRLLTAKGNKRKTQTIKAGGAKAAGTIKGKVKRDSGAASKIGQSKAAAKPTTRKDQLIAGAKKRNAQADRIDAKVKKLEGEYRSKDAAFYTQGVKPAGRDRMIAKSQKAAQLREESAALRSKSVNAEKMASKIKAKPIKSSGGNKRLERAIKNEAAGSTSYKRNPKGYQKRITALTAQKVYKTGDFMAGLSVSQASGKGFRVLRNERAAAKPASTAKQVSSSRQAATDRLKIKTQVRRAKSADRGSVVTPGQRSRLETGKGKTTKAAKPQSTLAKPRTRGNTKQQVASRVERKLGAERLKMDRLNRVERTGARQGNQRERSYKRQMTLERAQNFLKSGKLPGKDNSIAAQRSMKQARQRLAAKNAARSKAAKRPMR